MKDKDPAKDFAAIADDYAFFEAHSTEAEADVRAHLKHVAEIEPREGAIRMLDFGCGSGEFTAQFLAAVGWSAERLWLTLVDPAEVVRREAAVRLARFTDAPITESSVIPAGLAGSCDVVLANHVFYYVPNLVEHLRQLIEARAPGGVLLIAAESVATDPLLTGRPRCGFAGRAARGSVRQVFAQRQDRDSDDVRALHAPAESCLSSPGRPFVVRSQRRNAGPRQRRRIYSPRTAAILSIGTTSAAGPRKG